MEGSNRFRTIVRAALLGLGTFCAAIAPGLRPEVGWAGVIQPFLLIPALAATAFTIAAALSSSPTESKQADEILETLASLRSSQRFHQALDTRHEKESHHEPSHP